MITNEQQFILDALRQSLNAEMDNLSSWQTVTLNANEILKIIKRNGILNTVYPVLGSFVEIQNGLRDSFFAAIKQSVIQNYEGTQILQRLSLAGFDCIALKGWELQKLYPEPTMRQMADLDILVHPYRFHVIREQMLSLGYDAGKESAWMHDNFRKDTVKVEMHKRLTDDSGPIRDWERRLWKRTVPTGDGKHILRMSDEDFFLYHIIHMHKDFLNGSLGLRRIADTWLLTRSYPEMDQAYLTEELEKMGLRLFAERMVALSKATMGETEMDENSEIMLDHAFKYGIYGSSKSYKLGRIASMSNGSLKSGKLRSLIAALFLPYHRMKTQYPILEKKLILLPFFWLVRICHYLKGNVNKKKQMLDYSDIREADYNYMKALFNAGGV